MLRRLSPLAIVWLLACAPTEQITIEPLTIVNIAPPHGATLIDPTTNLLVTFSRALDSATAEDTNNLFLQPLDASGTPGAQVSITLEYDADTYTVILTPAANLDPATEYRITITDGVTDADGETLPATVTSDFTTA